MRVARRNTTGKTREGTFLCLAFLPPAVAYEPHVASISAGFVYNAVYRGAVLYKEISFPENLLLEAHSLTN